MILRSLKSGLLATVAVLAFLPTAAGATAADAATRHPVPGAVVQYDAQHPRTHQRGHAVYRFHHRVHLRRHHAHHARRVHRGHLSTAQGMAYRFVPWSMAYPRATWAVPYRLRYRLAARPVSYRHVWPATGRVSTRWAPLNVRSGPGTGYRVIGHRYSGRQVALVCRTAGSSVHGNTTWYRLAHHRGYVSAHYIRANRALPWC
ncbi:SH3 domain-containing protein [Streptomyces sp. NPDC001817]|uniref:SH3 domain-containing protein n=1 Tax=Streptomyces sp. NPDC001817 TaxID=3154398 RepID=UPI00331D92C2